MKKQIKAILITIAIFILSSLIVSLILSLLFFFQIFLTSTLHMIRMICSIIIFLVAGIVLGRLIKEKTFFYALGIAIVGFGLSWLWNRELFLILINCGKWLIFVAGSLISRNK